jgi:hypothetical protein
VVFWVVEFRESPTFQRSILPPFSGLKSKPKKLVEAGDKLSLFLLVSCGLSEIYDITTQKTSFHNHCHEKLQSNIYQTFALPNTVEHSKIECHQPHLTC